MPIRGLVLQTFLFVSHRPFWCSDITLQVNVLPITTLLMILLTGSCRTIIATNWWGALYQEGWSEKQFRQKSAETIKAEKCVLNKMKPMRMLLLPCHNFAKWGKTTTLSDWSKKCVQWKMSLEISLFSYCITMVLVLLDTGCRRYCVHFETNRSVFFWKTDRKIGSWV